MVAPGGCQMHHSSSTFQIFPRPLSAPQIPRRICVALCAHSFSHFQLFFLCSTHTPDNQQSIFPSKKKPEIHIVLFEFCCQQATNVFSANMNVTVHVCLYDERHTVDAQREKNRSLQSLSVISFVENNPLSYS